MNKAIILGNLGSDPDIRATQKGDKVANLSVATTERWKDQSGQRQEKSEWHRVVIFGKIAEVAERYLRKGSKVIIEGKLQTNKWQDNNGNDRYTTEIVVSGFGGNLTMLDSRSDGQSQPNDQHNQRREPSQPGRGSSMPDPSVQFYGDDLDDQIPF